MASSTHSGAGLAATLAVCARTLSTACACVRSAQRLTSASDGANPTRVRKRRARSGPSASGACAFALVNSVKTMSVAAAKADRWSAALAIVLPRMRRPFLRRQAASGNFAVLAPLLEALADGLALFRCQLLPDGLALLGRQALPGIDLLLRSHLTPQRLALLGAHPAPSC